MKCKYCGQDMPAMTAEKWWDHLPFGFCVEVEKQNQCTTECGQSCAVIAKTTLKHYLKANKGRVIQ